jgi:hypothetical protein
MHGHVAMMKPYTVLCNKEGMPESVIFLCMFQRLFYNANDKIRRMIKEVLSAYLKLQLLLSFQDSEENCIALWIDSPWLVFESGFSRMKIRHFFLS